MDKTQSKTAAKTGPASGITIKMKKIIEALLKSSEEMQKAIISRDVRNIWEILSRQQEKLAEFEQYTYLWNQLNKAREGVGSAEMENASKVLNDEIMKLRGAGRSNSSLIKSFLTAIKKAFMKAGAQMSSTGNKVYGKKGKMQLRQSKLLLNKTG